MGPLFVSSPMNHETKVDIFHSFGLFRALLTNTVSYGPNVAYFDEHV